MQIPGGYDQLVEDVLLGYGVELVPGQVAGQHLHPAAQGASGLRLCRCGVPAESVGEVVDDQVGCTSQRLLIDPHRSHFWVTAAASDAGHALTAGNRRKRLCNRLVFDSFILG
jgi:hypothetical protein